MPAQENAKWQKLNDEITTCRRCPRLVAWREQVARERKRAYRDIEYWGKPVPGFGDQQAQVLVVGLAPGAHGSNRTGRMFTGDSSGVFLYRALHTAELSSSSHSEHRQDGLELNRLFISAVCRCAPPANKPTPQEIINCLPYLEREVDLLEGLQGIVALGQIAFEHTLRLLRGRGVDIPRLEFGHGAFFRLGDGLPWMLASYHPSRQNTQTGRLTEAMFDSIWKKVGELLDGAG
jgi:uracil-DNA glycosylase family 4